jgi:anti-anti-sigma factor
VDDSGSPPRDDFGVRPSSIDGVSILAVAGELDIFTAPRLAVAIDDGIAAVTTAIIVDLSELEFLASAGMSVLLDGYNSAKRSGKRLIVVADGPTTSRPMKLMGLDQELVLRATLEDALRDVR